MGSIDVTKKNEDEPCGSRLKKANLQAEAVCDRPVSGIPICSSCCNGRTIEVLVVDDKNNPQFYQNVELKNNVGQSMVAITNREGRARFEGLDEGEYEVNLCKINCKLWSIEKVELLPKEKQSSPKVPHWEKTVAQDTMPRKHSAAVNECFTSIAALYGFDPISLWEDPANKDLKEKRKSKNILAEGDVVFIPEKKMKWEKVRTDQLLSIKKFAQMSSLNLQILDDNRVKRSDMDYLISITTRSRQVVPDRKGKTDKQGFLREQLPPDADEATITVFLEGNETERKIKLGGLDPIDTLRGKQQRLRNLGFYCELENPSGESTRNAVKRFQECYGLEVNGNFDKATVEKLKELARC
jgi:hypothetical protein